MTRMRWTFSTLVAAMAMAGSANAATNLLVNGGFENPNVNNGTYQKYLGSQSIPGWMVTGSDVLLIDRNYTEHGLVFNSAAGDQAVDLTGAGNTGPDNGIEQTVSGLTVGKVYRLSVEVGNAAPFGKNAGVYTLPSSIRVSLNGSDPLTFTNSTNNPSGSPGINFQMFSTDYVATSTDLTVQFLNGIGNDNYAGLDNASLTAVPEPMTWALMIMGFGGAGAMLRAKRSRSLVPVRA